MNSARQGSQAITEENERLKNLVNRIFSEKIKEQTKEKIETREVSEKVQDGKVNLTGKSLSELKKYALTEKKENKIKDVNVYHMRKEQIIGFLLKVNPGKYTA
jgi:nitrogen-specific signal transduction histidine kinase